tara:strand:+ start:17372 stop:18538 length:1167 start_codon:yes stop_codon:yes gene_type:complete
VGKEADLPPQSIYNSEKQYLLRRDGALGPDIGQRMYGLNRSTPMDAIRDMIRNYYSPSQVLDQKNVLAVVLRSESEIPTQYSLADAGKKAPISTMNMLRVRVFSDPRHYWIPAPKSSNDPAVNLHPYVRYDGFLQPGSVVTVDFDNDKYQFSSVLDIGQVTSIVGDQFYGFDGVPIARNRTTLPKEIPANYLRGQALLSDPAFNKKLHEVAKNLKTSVTNLVKIMEFESRLDPRIQNSIKATGLIQWMPATAIDIHKTTVDKIRMMSGVEQLDLVEDYFIAKGIRRYPNASLGTLYLLVLFPHAVNKPASYKIGSSGPKSKNTYDRRRVKVGGKWIYKYYYNKQGKGKTSFEQLFAIQNPIPGSSKSKGFVTKGEIVNYINSRKYKYA